MWKLLVGGVLGFVLSRVMSLRDQHPYALTERKPEANVPQGPIRSGSVVKPPEPSVTAIAGDAPASKEQLEQVRSAVDKRVQNATGKRRRRKRPAA